MNRSIPLSSAVEFVNVTSINPLISRCEIKVLYAGKNRNRSFISKEVAMKAAASLPGTPIIGQYLYEVGDFGDHGEPELVIDEHGIRFVKETVPYGFVPTDAKIWWKNFLDKDGVEREYMLTEGYLWTGRYPECKTLIETGRGQSMEFHSKSLVGDWSKIDNDEYEHFIIKEAFFEGLCILGEGVEPCFEGASITKNANLVYSLNKDDFKEKMTDFMVDLKDALVNFNLEGGKEMSVPNVEPVSVIEENIVPVVEEGEFAKKKKEEEEKKKEGEVPAKKEGEEPAAKEAPKKEGEEPAKKEGEAPAKKEGEAPTKEEEEEEKKKKKKGFYSLEEVVEYQELLVKFNALEGQYNAINTELNAIKPEYNKLKEMQVVAENKAKDEMIESFYMLSDEDKSEVVSNKLNYSLDEIESKLSVICVRNKVNFALDNTSETEDNTEAPIATFSVVDTYDATPSWLKAVDRIAQNRK